MGLPWHKADNAKIVAGMAKPYPEGFKVWPWLAMTEARAVVYQEVRSVWTVRELALRWGWKKTRAAEIVKAAEVEYAEASGQIRTDSGQAGDKTGQPMPSRSDAERAERTNPDSGRTGSGYLARVRSILQDQIVDRDAEDTPTGVPQGHEAQEHGQAARAERERPNFGDRPAPEDAPKVNGHQPPARKAIAPEDVIDFPAFVARWDAIAEELRPGVASVTWDGGDVPINKRSLWRSPNADAKLLAVYEAGRHLMPMLERYGECCRGEWGPSAHRAFERPDFIREINRLQLWVEKGKAPFWVKGEEVATLAPTKALSNNGATVNNDWLRGDQ